MEVDEAMTRRALDLLNSRRNDPYEAAVAALREDTQTMVGRHAGPRSRRAGRERGTVHRRRRGITLLSGRGGAAVVRGAQEGTGQPAAGEQFRQ
jgi:hypothetical protein